MPKRGTFATMMLQQIIAAQHVKARFAHDNAAFLKEHDVAWIVSIKMNPKMVSIMLLHDLEFV